MGAAGGGWGASLACFELGITGFISSPAHFWVCCAWGFFGARVSSSNEEKKRQRGSFLRLSWDLGTGTAALSGVRRARPAASLPDTGTGFWAFVPHPSSRPCPCPWPFVIRPFSSPSSTSSLCPPLSLSLSSFFFSPALLNFP